MKVLVCISCLLTGGTEIQTLSLVEALVKGGHTVAVACYFENQPEMVNRFRNAGAEVFLLTKDGLRPAGIVNTFQFLWKALRSVIKVFRPDVAHVQYMAPGALPIWVLRASGIKRIIATAHTNADIYPSLKQVRFVADHLVHSFQCITLRAERGFFGNAELFSDKTSLKRHGNHFTIYNNLPSYIEIAKAPRSGVPKTIGVVSRLEKIKGMDLVIPAFVKVLERHPDLKLIIAGDGSLKEKMKEQANNLGIGNNIEFLGRIDQQDLANVYDRIDILLMPSRSEGFGLTAIEGMARGCVPVVANTGGLPEVVEDGISGFLHNTEDMEDIANKIEIALSERDDITVKCIERANCFSSENYTALINRLYTSL